jgi:glycosyltransferase involved in cell wall biosynthesis
MGKWWWSILRVYEKWTLRNADKIFCITEEDRQVIVNEFGIRRENTCLVTAGIDSISDYQEKASFQQSIKQRHDISEETRLFLFSGLLSYKPNEDAVLFIRDKLVPKLKTKNPFSFKIIICGKGMNLIYTNVNDPKNHHIIYTGFVEDISEYIKAADLFLNPVVTGGGIKTKVIESIGFNTTVISTTSGAIGVQKEVCGNKLVVVPDGDIEIFTKAIVEYADDHSKTPPSYYQYYKWENIIEQAIQSLPYQST